MTARSVDVVEQADGACLLVVEAPGVAIVLELDADEAVRLAALLRDGGQAPALEEAS